MKKIELIIRPEKLEPLKKILSKNEYSGLTVMSAMGCGHQKGYSEEFKKHRQTLLILYVGVNRLSLFVVILAKAQ